MIGGDLNLRNGYTNLAIDVVDRELVDRSA
jgi:hypothetical protein